MFPLMIHYFANLPLHLQKIVCSIENNRYVTFCIVYKNWKSRGRLMKKFWMTIIALARIGEEEKK